MATHTQNPTKSYTVFIWCLLSYTLFIQVLELLCVCLNEYKDKQSVWSGFNRANLFTISFPFVAGVDLLNSLIKKRVIIFSHTINQRSCKHYMCFVASCTKSSNKSNKIKPFSFISTCLAVPKKNNNNNSPTKCYEYVWKSANLWAIFMWYCGCELRLCVPVSYNFWLINFI